MLNKLNTLTPIAAMLAMSLAGVAHAGEMPNHSMGMETAKTADAKCGADKGSKMKEGKCGEAKCGANAH